MPWLMTHFWSVKYGALFMSVFPLAKMSMSQLSRMTFISLWFVSESLRLTQESGHYLVAHVLVNPKMNFSYLNQVSDIKLVLLISQKALLIYITIFVGCTYYMNENKCLSSHEAHTRHFAWCIGVILVFEMDTPWTQRVPHK